MTARRRSSTVALLGVTLVTSAQAMVLEIGTSTTAPSDGAGAEAMERAVRSEVQDARDGEGAVSGRPSPAGAEDVRL